MNTRTRYLSNAPMLLGNVPCLKNSSGTCFQLHCGWRMQILLIQHLIYCLAYSWNYARYPFRPRIFRSSPSPALGISCQPHALTIPVHPSAPAFYFGSALIGYLSLNLIGYCEYASQSLNRKDEQAPLYTDNKNAS